MEKMIKALEWFIENDETNDIETNVFWIHGLESARRVVAEAKGETYEPLEWYNYDGNGDLFQ